jgi:hypothetical protein
VLLSMLPPVGLLYLIPVFVVVLAAAAMVTRLILPSDLRLAIEVARSRGFGWQAMKSGQDG